MILRPMTLPGLALSLALSLTVAAAAVAAEPSFQAGGIAVSDPYARAVPPGQPNSAVFMEIANTGGADRAVVAGSSTAADVVELHTHRMEDGMMRMRRIERIELPAGETVTLAPGGLHVMLIGLREQLSPGGEVALTLTFDDDSSLSLTAPVRKIAPMMGKGHAGHHGGSGPAGGTD